MIVEKFENLRKKAELQLLSGDSSELDRFSLKEIKSIIHELQVHQIELELQNEELINAQMKIKESEIKYYEFFNNAPVGFLVIDTNGSILEVNNKACDILGLDKIELLNTDLNVHIAWNDRDNLYFLLEKAKSSFEEFSENLKIIFHDESEINCKITAKLLGNFENIKNKIRITMHL